MTPTRHHEVATASGRLLNPSSRAWRSQALPRQREPAKALEVRADPGRRLPAILRRALRQQVPGLLKVTDQRALGRPQRVLRVPQLALGVVAQVAEAQGWLDRPVAVAPQA